MWTELTLKNIRKSLKMTQEKFSIFLKIPKRTIENWESGKAKPPNYVIELIEYKTLRELKERQCETCKNFWKCPKKPNEIIEENMCDKYENKKIEEYEKYLEAYSEEWQK